MSSKRSRIRSGEKRVSVIIPIHNSSRYLPRLFHSLSEQSLKNFEVLVVDDNSKDNGDSYCLQQISKYQLEGRVIKSPAKGPGSARNEGIRQANGEFGTFIDSDDFVLPNHLETLSAALGPATDIAEGLFVAVDEAGNVTSRSDIRGHLMPDRVNSVLTGRISAVSWGKLYRTSMLIDHEVDFPEGIHNGEDHVFSIYAYRAAREVACSFDYTYIWCRRANSLTRRKLDDKYLSDIIFVSRAKIASAIGAEVISALRARLSKQYKEVLSQIDSDHGKNGEKKAKWFMQSWEKLIESQFKAKENL